METTGRINVIKESRLGKGREIEENNAIEVDDD